MSRTRSASAAPARKVVVLASAAAWLAAAGWAPAQAGESVLYSFCSQSNCSDGSEPVAGLIADQQGNLYGTTETGGSSNDGTVFELSPPIPPATQWTKSVLYSFQGGTSDGSGPQAGLIFDQQGNLYGTTAAGGSANCGSGCGTVFELSPPVAPATKWTESVLYSFQGTPTYPDPTGDGKDPVAGLIFDPQGNLYGTTLVGGTGNCGSGGSFGCGTVFELTPPAGGHGPWTESVLHSFSPPGSSDGIEPVAGLIFDQQGNLYGTTRLGGGSANCSGGSGCGTVFELTPPAGGQGPWTESVLYAFVGGIDGATLYGGVIFDQQGNLYGTAAYGGDSNGACDRNTDTCGTVFKLKPPAGGQGPWAESTLYTFIASPNTGGANPYGGLIFDRQGALYGTAYYDGVINGNCYYGCGTVFKLTPPAGGQGSWTESTLYRFQGGTDGANPYAVLIAGANGALYGTTPDNGNTQNGASTGYGTVFQLCGENINGHNANTHDFNGDCTSDILWSDSSGDLAMWLMNGGQASSGATLGNVGTSWKVVGTRDFNGDGKADILWLDTGGDLGLWEMDGTGVASATGLGNVGTAWTVVGTGDFNGDGTGDILWRNGSTDDVAIWFMSNGQYASGADFGDVPSAWQIAGTGDFNGDGTTDILWHNTTTGDYAIWLMSNGQMSSGADLGVVGGTWTVVGTGDFNGDGTSDILWRDTSGDLAIWLMSNGQFSSGATIAQVPIQWSVAETGDFNGDGKSDIVWLCTAGGGSCSVGDLAVWLMNGTSLSSGISLGNVGTSWTVQGENAD